jgi:hypothetical protein
VCWKSATILWDVQCGLKGMNSFLKMN